MNTLEIKPEELKIVKTILQQHVPQATVWAFGSRVKGTVKPYSDLDLAIINYKPLTLLEQADLVEAFSNSDLPYKVDFVDWAITSENFKQIIQKQYIIIQ